MVDRAGIYRPRTKKRWRESARRGCRSRTPRDTKVSIAHPARHGGVDRAPGPTHAAVDRAPPPAHDHHMVRFQARACNTLAFRAVARSATHRHRARRLAPWPRARPGARTATLPWRGGRGAGKWVPSPLPQWRRPAGVSQRPRAGPSPRRAAHLLATGGAADTAHGWAGGIDRRATGRL